MIFPRASINSLAIIAVLFHILNEQVFQVQVGYVHVEWSRRPGLYGLGQSVYVAACLDSDAPAFLFNAVYAGKGSQGGEVIRGRGAGIEQPYHLVRLLQVIQ